MTIRPIDMQVMIPKATEAARSQQQIDQINPQQQQHMAEEWKKIANDRQQQVQHSSKSEGNKIGNEKQEQPAQQQQSDKQQAGQEDAADENGAALDPIRGHMVDIKT